MSDIFSDSNDVFVGVDAKSTFTNIPVNLAITILNERCVDIATHTALDRDIFFKAVSLCLENSYLGYDGVTYEQIKGCYAAAQSPSPPSFSYPSIQHHKRNNAASSIPTTR